MKILGSAICLALALSAQAWGAEAKLYSHRFAAYPNYRQDCDATARELLAHFVEMTGAKLGQTIVEPSEEGGGCNIAFDYTSEAPLPVESTFKGSFFSALDQSGGVYGSLGECQAALPSQREVFERATKLKAVVTYCYQVANLDTAGSDRQWVLRIDGFGVAAQHLYQFDEVLDGAPPADLAAVASRSLVALGVNVSSAFIKHGLGGIINELVIQYYARADLHLGFWRLTPATDGLCSQMLAVVPRWFAAAGATMLGAYCNWGSPGIAYSQLMVLRIPRAGAGIVYAPEHYPTYQQCMAAESAVFARYEQREKWKPFGALCDIGWHGYEMTLFGPRRGK